MISCVRSLEFAACVQQQVGDQVNTVRRNNHSERSSQDHDMAGINDSEGEG